MPTQLTIREQELRQTADMLLLNGTLTECPGLVHGKMGIAVFFFNYAKYTKNMLFADYAFDLIGEVQNQIHANSPADYEKGIAGIGVGVDYMIQNKFLITEDDVCEDFDQRMYRAVMHDTLPNFSLYDGLTGYGKYWITRLKYQTPSVQARQCLLYIAGLIEANLSNIPTEEQVDVYCFLHELQGIACFDSCGRLTEQCRNKWDLQSADVSWNSSRFGDSAVGNIVRTYQHQSFFKDTLQDEIDSNLRQIPVLDIEKAPVNMGLLKGYAGEAMLRLMALSPINRSWMNLL